MSIQFSGVDKSGEPKHARAAGRARDDAVPDEATTARLLSYIERVERLHGERKALADDISDVFEEAKGQGFVVKALRIIVKERAEDPGKRAEIGSIVEVYRSALGMAD